MSFTSLDFLLFFLAVFALHWLARDVRLQNWLLLAASYLFYGWVHPWYAVLLGASTGIDYFLARSLGTHPEHKRTWMALSLLLNLGVLAFFKYFDFFIPALHGLGSGLDSSVLHIALPVGLSFFTLKKLGYLLDVSSGTLKPVHSLRDFALYVSFFPQITAGPIDRPRNLLPQIEAPRLWKPDLFHRAWPLLLMGFFKKIVIADTIKVASDQIFILREPGGFLVIAGALAFTLQILADFSAYTDLARGVALLLGFETPENFNRPYLSLNPTDFWNRWHITLSTWLRDYIFFPARRALMRAHWPEGLVQAIPPLLTMLVSGLWHGAGWTFVVWGLYYGVLIVVYQMLGLRGDWKPKTLPGIFPAWLVMFGLIVFGWAIFRSPSLGWLGHALFQMPFLRTRSDLFAGLITLTSVFLYSLPLWIKMALDRFSAREGWAQAVFYAAAAAGILVYLNSSAPDFIYFQF